MASHQFIGVVEFGAAQEIQADGVNHHAGGPVLYDKVVRLGLRVQLEAILKAAASPCENRDTQGGVSGRFRRGDDLGDTGGGAVGNGELFHDAKIGFFTAELKRPVR